MSEEVLSQCNFLPNVKKEDINGETWYTNNGILMARYSKVDGGAMIGFTRECIEIAYKKAIKG